MRALKLRRLVLAAIFMFSVSYAGQPDVVEVLKNKYDTDKNIKVEFEHSIYWKVKEKEEKKKGTAYMSPGDMFRVELGDMVWVCNGQTYWQYSGGTSQVIIKRLLDLDVSMHPTYLLKTYLTEYEYDLISDDGKEMVIEWKAGEDLKNKFEKRITITIDKSDNTVSETEVVDRRGNINTYVFKKTEFGAEFPEKTFTFEIPKGCRVFDTRE